MSIRIVLEIHPGLESIIEGLSLNLGVELLKGVLPGERTVCRDQSCWYFCGEGVVIYKYRCCTFH